MVTFFGIVSAAPEDYEGRPISAIEFVPADQTLSQREIELILPTKPGDPLRMADVRAAIERLFATGRYTDIAVDAQTVQDQVVLRFLTEEAWFVGSVDVRGEGGPPNKGQLINAAKIGLGEPFSDAELKQASENILNLLRDNGLYKAKVNAHVTEQAKTDEVNVLFEIERGDRAKFSQPVINGNSQRDMGWIVRKTGWRRLFGILGWKTVTENRVQRGLSNVRSAYQKADYLMNKVALDKMDYDPQANRVKPALTIEAGDKVVIRTIGAKLSRGKLRQLVPVYQEQTVDRDLLVEGTRNIEEHFQNEGFFDVRVEFRLDPPQQDHQVIEYLVELGPRFKLVHLEIEGTSYFDDATIRERMFVMPASLLRFRQGRFSEDLLERDLKAITDLYHSNGFLDVSATSRVERDYKGVEREIAVFVKIEEGPQTRVASIEISGIDPRFYEQIRSGLQSSDGQPYSESNVATDRDMVLNFYFNNGYPDAAFESTATPGAEPYQVNLRYVINEGRRMFVRNVLISGLESTQLGLVEERITLAPGDPLSLTEMIDSQRRLYDLGIFARVDTAIQNPEGRERNKHVLYHFEEASRYSFTAGVGAQIARIGSGRPSLESPAGAAGFSPRISLGASRANFLGLGHTLSLQTRLSNIQQRAVLTYIAPQFRGNEDINLTFTGLYDDSQDVRTFSARRAEGSAQIGQRLTRANTMQYRIAYRRVTVRDFEAITTPQLIPLLSQPVRLGLIGGTFIQDRRDDPIETTRGLYNTVDTALSDRFLASQSQFTRILWRNSTYHRLGRDRVIARGLTFGWLQAINTDNPLTDVPVPERFFAGGAASHRGFPDNQAGPRDLRTGFPIGGKAILMSNLELRFPLIGDNIGGVLFHDAGNVYSKVSSISFRYSQRDLADFDYMVHAMGFGVRYKTPVGPVRVDLAYVPNSPRFLGYSGTFEELIRGVDLPSDPQRISRFQFHISIGQTF